MKKLAVFLHLIAIPTVLLKAEEEVDFAKHIYAVFQENCVDCHGPDKQKSDLRLDNNTMGFEEVVVPGKPEESELVRRISLPPDDPDIMPAKGDPLKKEQIERIKKWIVQGAKWPDNLPTKAGDGIDFAGQVHPILVQSCIECHGAEKQKGDLRLDSREAALHAIVPGKPEESELFKRITLPPDDLDIMPAEGDPLTKEQIAIIRQWIEEGAQWSEIIAEESEEPEGIDFSADIKPILSKLSPEEVDTLRRWVRTGGVWPLEKPDEAQLQEIPVSEEEKQAISKLQDTGALVTRVAQNVSWIRASFRLLGRQIGDEAIAPLADIRNLVEVDLANTAVTDEGLKHLAGLPNLTHLDLNNTDITDAGLEHLSGLPNLVYLNLYGTAVTDSGLEHLKGLKTLHKLYLWQTKVTDEGVKALELARPGIQVIRGWDLAAKPEEEQPQTAEKTEE